MNLLLHVCCGPCAAYPINFLKTKRPDLKPFLWYYNPNIHPTSEFLRRRDSLALLAAQFEMVVDYSPDYQPEIFLVELAALANQGSERCRKCYALRFEAAAAQAALKGCQAFGTTLAFSRRQKHDLIVEEGHRAASKYGLEFYYEDWRSGWQNGHEIAKSMGLYRQNYCGCIFSEFERFNNKS